MILGWKRKKRSNDTSHCIAVEKEKPVYREKDEEGRMYTERDKRGTAENNREARRKKKSAQQMHAASF